MRPAPTLSDAKRLAEPGEYVMCRNNPNHNPSWCVMTEEERSGADTSWTPWLKKE